MIKFNRKNVLLALMLGLAMFLGAYVMMKSSDSYKAAVGFLGSSPELIRSIGKVSDISLAGRSYEHVDTQGRIAHYEFKVIGGQDRGNVNVELASKSGVWSIVRASLVLEKNKQVLMLKDDTNP